MIAFGPVPSRRLGYSLGVNNIPPKNCTYDCLYCQVGPTVNPDLHRRTFYDPVSVFAAVKERVLQIEAIQKPIDYITLVPDGEPTLDSQLSNTLALLKPIGYKLAVITNGSLLWDPEVRQTLSGVDLVSVKVDAVDDGTWHKINRPNDQLLLDKILQGVLDFSSEFKGKLITETMLLAGINDSESCLAQTARFLRKLNPDVAYLAIPTRPTSERWVKTPDEGAMIRAFAIFSTELVHVELLTGYSTGAFNSTGNTIEELLNITSVHPMRQKEALEFIAQGGFNQQRLDELVRIGQLLQIEYQGQYFYLRKLHYKENIA